MWLGTPSPTCNGTEQYCNALGTHREGNITPPCPSWAFGFVFPRPDTRHEQTSDCSESRLFVRSSGPSVSLLFACILTAPDVLLGWCAALCAIRVCCWIHPQVAR